jgi:hypothetical protein
MGSKLEYLQNSCSGFGRDDFEDGVVVPALDVVVDFMAC